jgi:hypothetical protein
MRVQVEGRCMLARHVTHLRKGRCALYNECLPFTLLQKRLPTEYSLHDPSRAAHPLHVHRVAREGACKGQAVFNLQGTLIVVGLKAGGYIF